MAATNCYNDAKRARAYAKLEFSGTYFLAYRDLPDILFEHANGKKALDFGCGAGRSTRFLKKLGFDTVGVDIAKDMIEKALEMDPDGNYILIKDGRLSQFENNTYDLTLSAFAFDNIPSVEKKVDILGDMGSILKRDGIIVNLVSSPEIYINEWASFSTGGFPEKKKTKSGDKVKIIITDIEDKRPVEDFMCTDDDYKKIFKKAGLELVKTYKPLARESDTYKWVSETSIAPWTIYVLTNKTSPGEQSFTN